MGVDTKAILRKGVTVEQIQKALSEKYGKVEVRKTSMPDFFYFDFAERSMAVSYSNSCERDYGISGVWCCLSCYGESINIMRYLCETFGGYLDENDCDLEDFYPINFHLYSQGKDFNNYEKCRIELLSCYGFDNLNKAFEIIEKYYTLKN